MRSLVVIISLILGGCTQSLTQNQEVITIDTGNHANPAPSPKVNPKIYRCSPTKFIGWKDVKDLSKYDEGTYNRAKKRCPQLYPDSPCVKMFELRGELSYWVTCGKEEK